MKMKYVLELIEDNEASVDDDDDDHHQWKFGFMRQLPASSLPDLLSQLLGHSATAILLTL